MKNIVFTFIAIFTLNQSYAQQESEEPPIEINVHFDKKIDTIYQTPNKLFEHSIKVITHAQKAPKGTTIKIELLESDLPIDKKDIGLTDIGLKIDEEKDEKGEFKISLKNKSTDDRIVKLGIVAKDSTGKKIPLKPGITTKIIHIKNISGLKKNWDNEFWLFTGTNLDLLDGPLAKDLYFRSTYLQNLNLNEKKSLNWFFISFGKNRYFSDIDSSSQFTYVKVLKNINQDSSLVEQGIYRSYRKTKSENISIDLNLMRELKIFSTEDTKLFFMTGLNLGLQTSEEVYDNNNILRKDTSIIRISPSSFGTPIRSVEKSQQFNTDVSFGLMHILAKKNINVKTMMMTGFNSASVPSFGRSRTNPGSPVISNNEHFFFKARIDATVLDPGISLGFEIYTRHGKVPQFNASFTKVFDLQNLGNAFGKVNQAKDFNKS